MNEAARNLRFEIFCVYRIGIEKRKVPDTESGCGRAFLAWEGSHRQSLDLIADDAVAKLYASLDGLLADRKRMRLIFLLTHLLVRLERDQS